MPQGTRLESKFSGSLNGESTSKDRAALNLLKADRIGKKFELVKISDNPPTWKEVEIKD